MAISVKLTDRLKKIAAFIENGSAVADIGTDHGYLPVYLAQNGLARHIIASDISAGSLSAARRSADKYGVSDQILFITASGLSGVKEAEVDTVVISGVGGETIIGILKDAPWTRRQGISLILQPQTKKDVLFEWLRENGYVIRDSAQALERGRSYIIILAAGV